MTKDVQVVTALRAGSATTTTPGGLVPVGLRNVCRYTGLVSILSAAAALLAWGALDALTLSYLVCVAVNAVALWVTVAVMRWGVEEIKAAKLNAEQVADLAAAAYRKGFADGQQQSELAELIPLHGGRR